MKKVGIIDMYIRKEGFIMNKNKKLPWALICLGIVCALNLTLVISELVFQIGKDSFDSYWLTGNFGLFFTSVANIATIVCILYHCVVLFWKNRSVSLLYIVAAASLPIIYVVEQYLLQMA